MAGRDSVGMRLQQRCRAVGAWLGSILGLAECLLLVGVGLVTGALWPAYGRLALLPAGVLLIWIALPSRTAFVVRPVVSKKPRRP